MGAAGKHNVILCKSVMLDGDGGEGGRHREIEKEKREVRGRL
jgi:hypothetical protein